MRQAVALALLAVLGVAGCGRGHFSDATNAASANVFRYPVSSSPSTFDPAIVQDLDAMGLLADVFEGLVGYDANNNVAPKLAESWKITNGGLTYVFTIRKDAKFQNGRAVSADDVKWSFERATAKDFPSPTAQEYLSDIVGVNEKNRGLAQEISGLKVLDARHISITIDKPRGYFLGKLTYPCADILAKEAAGPSPIKSVAQAIGTGPFKFKAYLPDQKVVLEANPGYYLGAPRIAGIERQVVKDANTRINLFRGGSADYLSLERQDVVGAEKDPQLKPDEVISPSAAIYYVGLNEKTYPPFANREVRRAFLMAVDREKIAKQLLGGVLVANGFLAPGIPGYRADLKGVPYDPAGARQLLAKAGYPNGVGLPEVTLAYRDQKPDARIASEAVAGMLRDNLNVPIKLRSMEWGSMLKVRNSKQLQMVFASWYADYLDPQNFLSMLLTTTASGNYDNYSNPEFDRLCAQGDSEPNQSTRAKLYQQAEDVLIADAARMPLYFDRDVSLLSPRVKGLKRNLFGLLPPVDVKLLGK